MGADKASMLEFCVKRLVSGAPLVGVLPYGHAAPAAEVLFTYVWLAASMGVAYLAKVVEGESGPRRHLSAALLYLAGYGSLLCAITLAAYAKELRGAEAVWEKTEKTGKIGVP